MKKYLLRIWKKKILALYNFFLKQENIFLFDSSNFLNDKEEDIILYYRAALNCYFCIIGFFCFPFEVPRHLQHLLLLHESTHLQLQPKQHLQLTAPTNQALLVVLLYNLVICKVSCPICKVRFFCKYCLVNVFNNKTVQAFFLLLKLLTQLFILT